ncbi:MAG: hypothetical protein JKX78_15645 [Alteromonadaceae bacterium]|nr:hypothetical protein [Alteromonadaceae bacterium]
MIIEQFIHEKTLQLNTYIKAVLAKTIHYTELDLFINDVMEEWTSLLVTEESPNSARERVFWHLIHELCLHGAQALQHDLFLKSEVNTCIDFFDGVGSYPIDCIGWRPIA